MGTNRTGVIVEKMLSLWDPAVVVVVGIAGGIHADVRLGDVVVASEVNNYIEAAKAVDATSGVAFQRGNDSFKTKHGLLERVRNFEFAHRASFLKWEANCAARNQALGSEVEPLRKSDLLREKPSQKEGHLASGPVVVTSRSFVAWIREGDRACLGIEMEAGGLMIAAHMDPSQRDALVVRGVSDFSDDRKVAIDKIGDGKLRRYAMENATDFLWSLMEAGALPRRVGAIVRPRATETIQEALLRVFAENADENGEVTATWRQIRDWIGRTTADLHAVAIHLNQDGHFRSAMFEGGPDGICNVVLRR
jgi:nucleoside phosphorylase